MPDYVTCSRAKGTEEMGGRCGGSRCFVSFPPSPFSVITRCQRLALFAKPGTWFCRDPTRGMPSFASCLLKRLIALIEAPRNVSSFLSRVDGQALSGWDEVAVNEITRPRKDDGS